jgi:lactate dehydrogenase-like 2-hydroxyacid dehydrogenase
VFLINEPENFPADSISKLQMYGRVYLNIDDAIKEAPAIKVVFMRLGTYIDKKFVTHFPNLQTLATPTTGLNHISSEILGEFNIVSLQGEREFLDQIPATAEFTFLSILMSLKKIRDLLIANTTYRDRDTFLSNDLQKKNVLLLGLGRIGIMVADFLKAFGANVYYIDNQVENSDYKRLSWEDDFEHIDVLSIHLSYNDNNKSLLDLDFLRKFKKLKVFVNTARGELVDEDDLVKYIFETQKCEFVIDVVNNEQKEISSPLYRCKAPNLFLTPHVAGNSIDSREEVEKFITSKVLKLIRVEKNV